MLGLVVGADDDDDDEDADDDLVSGAELDNR